MSDDAFDVPTYTIEYDGHVEGFGGEDSTTWFFDLLDAIWELIDAWHVATPPRTIRIMVRREPDDRAEYPFVRVKDLEVQRNEAPWVDLDALECLAPELFARGQALRAEWRKP